ncbi:efflux RND transporter permease subunit [Alkaliphilus peptidifermentans]|uniref:Hydrophobic/amphiphilic exporter-1, HAE1 family n=1 Tax=Alkaliphilus peptidifermentans DSM 18978 TaxID=1120976 RepID=A0A1G5EZ83_9FIRM|nr:efflux RND transporter permease subunit [Alkaliphilus peptidifermentans]SCY32272.1 hydrophobic/amphiphilic exporter-1, HAE1 family [Alkaliphilus peptidifermentans DSM 18978]
MNLSNLAVRRPVTIVMIMLIIVLLGTISLTRLPIDLYPALEIPVAIVSTSYSGVGPNEIENLVTRPIEGAIATVSNIDSITSITSQGSSIVIAQFNYGTDMDFASLDMRERIDLIKGMLPEGAMDPMVLTIDPNAFPIMQISLTNEGDDLNSLQILAEDSIKPRLERIEGVASVDVTGGYTNEVEIKANQQILDIYGITLTQLAQLIGASNMNLPGGTLTNGEKELNIRTMGEFSTIDEIKEIPIALPTGGIVLLKDIAEVELAHKDIQTISRTNGQESINITIQKQSDTNTVQVASLIHNELQKLQNEFSEVNITIVSDESTYITGAINNVLQNVIMGGIFAIMILYLFLRNIRSTLIIGTSIPIAVIGTFALLYFGNITLNLMTLGGLALGVGMLVDNAIVVLENIYRFRVEGYSRKEAASAGASEVAMAVTASTLTTIAVFLPIVFVDGMISSLFTELALAVTFSLVASLVVSLTLIPMLASKILKVDNMDVKERKGIRKGFKHIYDLFDKAFNGMENRYKKLLSWSLGHRKITMVVAILIFLGSLSSIFLIGVELFPASDEGLVNISVTLPVGAELHEVNNVLLEIEESISSVEEIDTVFSSIGGGGQMSLGGSSGNRGSITVTLTNIKHRNRNSKEIADEIRELVKDIPGAEINVTEAATAMGMMGGDPISISLRGDDLEILQNISEDFKRMIESVPDTREITTSFSEGIPEVQVHINKYSAATYGLTTAQIANSIRNTTSGITATRYKYDGNEIDVVIKGDDSVTDSLSNLQQMKIPTATGGTVPLNQVANVSIERGPVQINRENQQRVVTISGQIGNRDLRSVTQDIEEVLKGYDLPQGYTYNIGGQNKEMNDAFADLLLALVLAVILIYMVMAAQFESLLHPLVIMLSVPVALAGALLGLLVTGTALGITALIGIIMLSGIVVNNAIVLVDYINTLRNAGKDRHDAIITAGPVRLRPILMTTLTTVLGLLPLAIGIGEGAEIQAPMGIVVIAGLLLSTILTLVLIPTVYTLVDDLSVAIKRKIKGKKEIVEM